MAIFDGRLIDPTEKELARSLGKAMRSANTENKRAQNRIDRDSDFWERFARDVLRGGKEGRRRSCKGGHEVPEVVTGWWTDPAGRKHIRVVGRTRSRYSRLRRETEMRELPPWWHVYPEAVLGVRGPKEKGERYIAVCRCGAVGTPGSLGWMGDTCGPCFDRRADGGTPSTGFGQFNGWNPDGAHVTFSADGRHLIGQSHTGVFWKVCRDDGSSVTSKRKFGDSIVATGRNEAGVVMGLQDGGVFRWRSDDKLEEVLPRRHMWGRAAMPPDGSRFLISNYQQVLFADLTAEEPKYETIPVTENYYAFQFDPNGTRLLAATSEGDIVALNPATMAPTALRHDAFAGIGQTYGPPCELVVSHDATSILVRRDSYSYNGRTVVRHVPLPSGALKELQIPAWHKPTVIAYSPDARHAITTERDGWVGFWDLSSGKALGYVRAVLEDTSWHGGQIAFAPDGSALAVAYGSGYGSNGSTVAVWPWPDVSGAAQV